MNRLINVTLIACAMGLSHVVMAANSVADASMAAATNVTPSKNSPVSTTEIKVRVLKLSHSFEVSGVGLRFSGSRAASQQSLSILPVKKTAVVGYRDGTWIVSNNDKTLKIYGSKLEVSGETLAIARTRVPASGQFVARERKGKSAAVDFVAKLPIEEYLVDVVASEVPFHWPLEAQKAQAVAARSYALSIMKERRKEKFDIDSSTLHQVYQYGRSALRGGRFLAKIREAVSSTREVVLADSGGRLLKSYFHAHCGGQTEEPKEVWGVGPAFGLVNDNGCALSRSGQWKTRIPFSEVIHRLARNQKNAPLAIRNVEMKYKMGSERVQSVVITGLEGRVQMKAQNFREMFGYDRVKSTLFVARVEGEALVIQGRGHGHGVGMCQTGARLMALGGSGYEEILRRYYPSAQIVKPVLEGPALAAGGETVPALAKAPMPAAAKAAVSAGEVSSAEAQASAVNENVITE